MKLSIPQPCTQKWDDMQPADQGRYCSSCAKTVVDFTSFSTNDIVHYFKMHAGEKTCGRMRKSQLESINIQIPVTYLKSIPQRSRFLYALFLAFGTTLFGCTDHDGNQRKIDKIEVVDSAATFNADTGAQNCNDGTLLGEPCEAVSEPPIVGDIEVSGEIAIRPEEKIGKVKVEE